MSSIEKFKQYVKRNGLTIGKVIDFDIISDQLYPFDFTKDNKEITPAIFSDTDKFSHWINQKLADENCKYGIGGYNEHRTIYARSDHFDATGEEPRRLHLGVDIWGKAGTPVYNFHPAEVHSFQFNDTFGDYGATIILKYQLDDLVVYGLYGHLSLASLTGLEEGQQIAAGKQFAYFGIPNENGHWPPHLHFQLIFDMKDFKGDYPGVCQFSQRESFLANSPDPELILKYTFHTAFKR